MLAMIRILLGPALLLQGRQVRKKILRMPEPPGPRQGAAGQGAPLSLLILGDSSAAGVGAPDQSQAFSGQLVPRLAETYRVTWRVEAKTGWTTQDALDALDRLDGARFDLAVLSLGVNDVTTETGLARWQKTYATLLDRLAEQHGVRYFILSGMPPMGRFPVLPQPLRWYLGQQAQAHDRALGRMARTRDRAVHAALDFSDMGPEAAAEDGFHPGPPIYASWAAQVDRAVRGLLDA